MRLPRMLINTQYTALNREIPDALATEGAIISTDIGRLMTDTGIEWLRKNATKYRKDLQP